MAQTYTIESADDSAPIDPGWLRELAALLRDHGDLDLGVRLKDRPPAPGEQGAIAVALEIVATAKPLDTAFASVLRRWIDKHKLTVSVSRTGSDYSVRLSGGTIEDALRLIAKLEAGGGAERGDSD